MYFLISIYFMFYQKVGLSAGEGGVMGLRVICLDSTVSLGSYFFGF